MRLLNDKKIHKTFKEFFDREDIRQEIRNIEKFLCGLECAGNFYPYDKEVFRFACNDLSKVKCIILGMDPYPSDYMDDRTKQMIPVATGRSFEVRNLKSWKESFKQSSLQNILKSLYFMEKDRITDINFIREEIKKKRFRILEPPVLWTNLEEQGVMWLNAVFTVKIHEAGSHIKIWQHFTDELIKYIVSKNDKIKWMIWGDIAYSRVKEIVSDDKIIYTCHPASRVKNDFVISCPFKKVKEIMWIGRVYDIDEEYYGWSNC